MILIAIQGITSKAGDPMRCHTVGLVVTLALSLLAVPLVADAQRLKNVPRIGVLEPGPTPGDCLEALRQSLGELGYREGQTILFDYRYAAWQPDQLLALAAEIVRLTPDVLWTHSGPAAQAIKQATTTIPIVVGVAGDLVEQGLVESLARPGGNLTGLDLRDVERLGKQLELLKEAVPTVSRVAVLVNPTLHAHAGVPGNIEAEARALGVQLQRVEAEAPEAFEGAFAAMVQEGADALMIMAGPLFARHRQRLLELALRHRLSTMAGERFFAEAGSLPAYGAYARELCQRSAVFVDKILKGAKPADLPVEQAYKFSLSVNLKTAEALGLTLSPLFLFRADEVLR
jgi:putative ABC transport system substrate-binding protein